MIECLNVPKYHKAIDQLSIDEYNIDFSKPRITLRRGKKHGDSRVSERNKRVNEDL